MSIESIPANWCVTKLDNISSDISYGYTAKSSSDHIGPRLLRITDIQDNRVDWSGVPFCEIDEKAKCKYLLQSGDLVVARTGATVGKSFLIRGEIPESVYASYLIRVRLPEQASIEFLSYFFQSPDYWKQITEFSAGIGQPNVNGSKLKDLSVPLPPLAEQKQIAAKLDELLAQVDTIKTRLDAIPHILKRFRQSVLAAAVSGKLTAAWRREVMPADCGVSEFLAASYQQWKTHKIREFERKSKNVPTGYLEKKYIHPKVAHSQNGVPGWITAELQDIAEVVDPNPSHRMPSYVENGYSFISSENILDDGCIDFGKGKKIVAEEVDRQRERYEIYEGTFAFSRIGTIGKSVFLPNAHNYGISHAMAVISPYTDITSPRYLRSL